MRIGIAGLGVASTQVLPPVAKLPFVKITAAADTRTDALAKFREVYEGEGYKSVEALCASPNVDAVYIATPNSLHAGHAITAAKHKKHIIVEKPMALSIAECDAMNEAAEQNGVKLLCGHTHSFDPPIRKIREIVKSGELGGLLEWIAHKKLFQVKFGPFEAPDADQKGVCPCATGEARCLCIQECEGMLIQTADALLTSPGSDGI